MHPSLFQIIPCWGSRQPAQTGLLIPCSQILVECEFQEKLSIPPRGSRKAASPTLKVASTEFSTLSAAPGVRPAQESLVLFDRAGGLPSVCLQLPVPPKETLPKEARQEEDPPCSGR